jgi:glucose/arabinose dehydrogenase
MRFRTLVALFIVLVAPSFASAQLVGNPACPGEDVFYNPGHGEDILLPDGYKVEVFVRDLNMPTDIAFAHGRAYVLESGTGLPGRCNNNELPAFGGKFSASNPFTPDILIFNSAGQLLAGPLGKPTAGGGGFQADGPAIGLAFEHNFSGGTLFATDSNQGVRGAPGVGNNTSRIVTVTLPNGTVTPFIVGLPTGDHPTEQIIVKDGWLYWSQGSATNSGVTGHDNGAGGNQHDIACEKITLSNNTFDSGDGHLTSGYSNHGVARPGAVVPAFEGATQKGMCTGAILRAKIHTSHPEKTIEPFSWGYRNPFGIRFAPHDHALKGGLFVSENGEDERGARPTNFAPDRLQLAQQRPDGRPDYHGWPDRFGFLESTQAVFNPVGGPGDDNPAAVVGKPVLPVLAFPPQPPVAPLALQPADVAAVGHDFAPDSFIGGIVKKGASLVSREGDFGFSRENGVPSEGHDVELVNFSKPGQPLKLELTRFAFNCKQADQVRNPGQAPQCNTVGGGGDQAFTSQLRGINRPVTARFGPDGALYVVDYGAVRDFGQADPDSKFTNPADAPLVVIPHTGVIWRISRVGGRRGHDDDD